MLESPNGLNKRDIYHGDARIQDVIAWKDTIYWVNFRTSSRSASRFCFALDVKQFLESAHVEFHMSVIQKQKDNLNVPKLVYNIGL